jgi:FkbH-like protein
MELDEVRRAHPGMECIQFPKNDPQAVCELIQRLRDLFGKTSITEEDRIRSSSLRAATQRLDGMDRSPADIDEFLKNAAGSVSSSWRKAPLEPRALELINKTNQFNMNGRRFTEVEWAAYAAQPNSRILLVEYLDKYGPLGKIAALAGRREGARFLIDVWVMSCRAFSRRVEYHTLNEVFERCEVAEVLVDFQPTPRNAPFAEFISAVVGQPTVGPCVISRRQFDATRPAFYAQHAVGAK